MFKNVTRNYRKPRFTYSKFVSYMSKKGIFRCLFIAMFCASTLGVNGQSLSTKQYIDVYKYAAMQEMKIYKIPASITLGQGILESASGNSKLAKDCNNHFGIKCRKNWTGPHCLADDDAPNECFRGYGSAMESYRDHSLFLKENSRYGTLFTYQVTDYKSWATGLKTAGYATNPAYASTLIGVIEKYRLTMYDSMVLLGEDYFSPDTAAQRIISTNGIESIVVKKGDSPESIARQFEMGSWQVYKYNDLKRGEDLNPGEIVYLKPKRRKGDTTLHVVKEGESMRQISQEHTIKLKQLYKKNRLKPGQQVKPGEVLLLQKKAPLPPEIASKEEVQKTVPPVKTIPPKPTEKKVEAKEATDQLFHEVKEGETLLSIAMKSKVTVAELKRWNNLASDEVKTGQLLVLKPGDQWNGKDTTVKRPGYSEIQKSSRYHIVMNGETLYGISKLYGVKVDSLIVWNNLAGKTIKEGMELRVSKPNTKKEEIKEETETPNIYQVQAGDTLYSISRKFGISVEELKKLNGLTSNAIAKGQSLKIK